MDGGGLKGTGTASIRVKDINDMPPTFTKDEWVTEVDETDGNRLPDTPILTVTVHDEDESNKFHYKVREGINGENSGDCSLRQNCDSVLFIERLVCNRMIDRGNFIHVGVSSDTEHLVFNLCKHFIN